MTDDLDPIGEAKRQWLAHGWTDAADGMELVTSLVRVHQLLDERIDTVLRPLGLTFARFEVLRLLAFTRDGSMTMTRLGSLLQVHPASVTNAVDRLEAQGFATRERSDHDRRVVRASVTDAGREIVDRATQGLNKHVFSTLGLAETDVAALTSVLTVYRREAGDLTN